MNELLNFFSLSWYIYTGAMHLYLHFLHKVNISKCIYCIEILYRLLEAAILNLGVWLACNNFSQSIWITCKIVCMYIEVCAARCVDFDRLCVLSLQESTKVVNVCVWCRLNVCVLFSKCRGSNLVVHSGYQSLDTQSFNKLKWSAF